MAAVFAALFFTGLLPVTLLFDKAHFPSPQQPTSESVAYFRTHGARVGWCAFFQFGSAVPLGIYTATMVSRLRFLGVRVAGVDIAHFGGFMASAMVMVSGLGQWVLAQPGSTGDDALSLALYHLVYATGGSAYSVTLGLLCAGLAVPALLMRLVPRWLALCGIGLVVIGELSVLSLIVPEALPLIPLTCFPAFIWLILMGAKLPAGRPLPT